MGDQITENIRIELGNEIDVTTTYKFRNRVFIACKLNDKGLTGRKYDVKVTCDDYSTTHILYTKNLAGNAIERFKDVIDQLNPEMPKKKLAGIISQLFTASEKLNNPSNEGTPPQYTMTLDILEKNKIFFNTCSSIM